MLQYGTNIVAGVSPGKGGTEVHGVPVYDTVDEAIRDHDANTSIVFVPAPLAKDAVLEAIYAGIKLIVVITEFIPVRDTIEMVALARKMGSLIVGPNTPGIISPEVCKVGIMPAHVFKKGSIGIISRSGTLTYEIALNLTRNNLGQSTCVGIGGDPVTGTSIEEMLALFEMDKETKAVVIIGEIGGEQEERAAEFIKREFNKPVVAFIAGRSAPPEKRMGHAGAIISGRRGTAYSKISALQRAGAMIANCPAEVPKLLKEVL